MYCENGTELGMYINYVSKRWIKFILMGDKINKFLFIRWSSETDNGLKRQYI